MGYNWNKNILDCGDYGTALDTSGKRHGVLILISFHFLMLETLQVIVHACGNRFRIWYPGRIQSGAAHRSPECANLHCDNLIKKKNASHRSERRVLEIEVNLSSILVSNVELLSLIGVHGV